MRRNPEKWAEKLFEVQGYTDAYAIIERFAKPMVGMDESVPNPSFKFYQRALKWALRNKPKGDA